MRHLLGAMVLTWALPVAAAERILSFDSEISVHGNGSQTVVETIRVRAEGRNIKRGIYREFPTEYRTHTGSRMRVEFRVVEVLRDGKREAWHTRRLSNGVRVYIGRKNVFLEPGEYTYRLTYTTDRQLGFFKEHDELYWNVTGNGWAFQIDRASARVHLPPGVPQDDVLTYGYTGKQGATGGDYRAKVTGDGAQFVTTRPLRPHEGLTISVGWPKGFVHEPTWQDRLEWQWRDDPALFVVWGGVLVLTIYYLLAWYLVGVDPKRGVVVPQYEPPEGYPPAALRMVRRMGWDDKALSAALVGLAVRGAVKISENDDEFSVSSTGKENLGQLAPGEKAILGALGLGTLVFRSSNHKRVKKMRDDHRDELENQFEKRYFYSNRGWAVAGYVLTVACIGYAAIGVFETYGPQAFFFLFFSGFIGVFVYPFFRILWEMYEPYRRTAKNWVQLAVAGVPLLFFVFYFASSTGGFKGIGNVIPWGLVAGVVTIGFVNVIFLHLLKAPTRLGRKLLDQIEGFRDYLGIAESDELKFKYAKPVTPEVFEAYLPYAIALDVETEWANRFAAQLRQQGQQPSSYRTTWYDGHSFGGVRGLSSSVGSSLATTVSSASRPPGSSSGGGFSGGGGGGFSGGGGGGGGGGGW